MIWKHRAKTDSWSRPSKSKAVSPQISFYITWNKKNHPHNHYINIANSKTLFCHRDVLYFPTSTWMWKQTVTPIRTLADAELTCIFQMSRVAEITITRIHVLRTQLIPKFLCRSLFIFTSATSTATTYCKNYLLSLLAKLDGSSFDVPRLSLGELKHLLVKMGNLSNPTANSTVGQSVSRSLVISNTFLDQPSCLVSRPIVAASFLNSLPSSDWSPGRLGFCMGVTI